MSVCSACGFEHSRHDTPEQARIRCEWAQERARARRTAPPPAYDPDADRFDRAYEFQRTSRWRRRWDAYCREHPEAAA